MSATPMVSQHFMVPTALAESQECSTLAEALKPEKPAHADTLKQAIAISKAAHCSRKKNSCLLRRGLCGKGRSFISVTMRTIPYSTTMRPNAIRFLSSMKIV
jgi:hypothetical protein